MPFIETGFPGLLVFEPAVFEDIRGYFFESYNEKIFNSQGIETRFVQDNQSSSFYGVIRGLHYQLNPKAQSKLVRVLTGKILDVVVDIRKGSPTFGKNFTLELSANNRKQLYIPKGFAHGFSVLSEKAEVFYKCDEFYSREHEGGIQHNDPELYIEWGIPEDKKVVSEKDGSFPLFANCKNNFVFNS